MCRETLGLLLQGPIHRNTLRNIAANIRLFDQVVISTWEPANPSEAQVLEELQTFVTDARWNVLVVVSPTPVPPSGSYNPANLYFQTLSVLAGIFEITTDLVVKGRSDELYDLAPFVTSFCADSTKPTFLNYIVRQSSYYKFHMSDHLLAAETQLMECTWREVERAITRYPEDWRNILADQPVPEVVITMAMLRCLGASPQEISSATARDAFRMVQVRMRLFDVEQMHFYELRANHISINLMSDFRKHARILNPENKLRLRHFRSIEDLGPEPQFLHQIRMRTYTEVSKWHEARSLGAYAYRLAFLGILSVLFMGLLKIDSTWGVLGNGSTPSQILASDSVSDSFWLFGVLQSVIFYPVLALSFWALVDFLRTRFVRERWRLVGLVVYGILIFWLASLAAPAWMIMSMSVALLSMAYAARTTSRRRRRPGVIFASGAFLLGSVVTPAWPLSVLIGFVSGMGFQAVRSRCTSLVAGASRFSAIWIPMGCATWLFARIYFYTSVFETGIPPQWDYMHLNHFQKTMVIITVLLLFMSLVLGLLSRLRYETLGPSFSACIGIIGIFLGFALGAFPQISVSAMLSGITVVVVSTVWLVARSATAGRIGLAQGLFAALALAFVSGTLLLEGL